MSRRILEIAAVATILSVGARGAGSADLPSKATYFYFVDGKSAGRSEIRTVVNGGITVVTSTSEIAYPGFKQTLACRTEYDRATGQAKVFKYEGFRDDQTMSGTVSMGAGEAEGQLEANGAPYSGKAAWDPPTYLFQDYVPDHLMAMGRDLLAFEKSSVRFSLLFPASMVLHEATATHESEIELPVRPRPVVCRKVGIRFKNAAPFYVYVDIKRAIPVYLEFPAVRTEVFLQDTWGDKPMTKYAPSPEPTDQ
jgi:hypothetical protein